MEYINCPFCLEKGTPSAVESLSYFDACTKICSGCESREELFMHTTGTEELKTKARSSDWENWRCIVCHTNHVYFKHNINTK